jgi:ABC-type branched-subunit amino acid transport system ATPase component
MPAFFEVRDLHVRFGGLRALSDVSFGVKAGEAVGIVGANGAGKTTLLNCITGMVRPTSGRILYEGVDIVGRSPNALLRSGLVRSFQSPTYFRDMTVLEYAICGQLDRVSTSLVRLACRPRRFRKQYQHHEAALLAGLREYDIVDDANARLGDLPYGMQKYVDIVRAVLAGPRILFLDEPTSGSSSEEREIMELVLEKIKASGITLVMVDHDVDFVQRMVDTVILMDAGEIVISGEWETVARHPPAKDILGIGL